MSLAKPFFLLGTLASMIAGCSHPDHRLVEQSRLASEQQAQQNFQQAQQNQQMATLQQEVAAGSRRLVELDGQSRQEFLSISHDLQQQSQQVANERDELEAERKELAQERRSAPVVAAAITTAGLICACVLPLLLSVLLLRPPSAPEMEGLVDLLVDELALPQPQRLEQESAARIPEVPSAPRLE